jgi:hypothetical protein
MQKKQKISIAKSQTFAKGARNHPVMLVSTLTLQKWQRAQKATADRSRHSNSSDSSITPLELNH